MKKMGSLILSIIFALCLLSGCAVKIAETPILIDETPAVEAPSVPSKVFVLESFTLKRLKWLDTKKQYTVGKNSKLNMQVKLSAARMNTARLPLYMMKLALL